DRPHLIIAGPTSSGMDTGRFIERLKAQPALADIPVMLCANSADARETRIAAATAGVEWVVCKSADRQDVLQAVNRMLDRGTDEYASLSNAAAPESNVTGQKYRSPFTDQLHEAESNVDLMTRLLACNDGTEPTH